MPPRRRAARRTGRRSARRTTRRVVRRRRRRRIVIGGGMVLLAAGGAAAAVKMTSQDADRVEEHTGVSAEELTEEELVAAMDELGIQSIELDENDQAIITDAGDLSEDDVPASQPAAAATASEESYLEELEKLADLRDKGIITNEDFEAKKNQLLGI